MVSDSPGLGYWNRCAVQMEPDRAGETLRAGAFRFGSFIVLYAQCNDRTRPSVLRVDGQRSRALPNACAALSAFRWAIHGLESGMLRDLSACRRLRARRQEALRKR